MNNPNLKNNFEECIGNTPLIKLKIASEISGCNIYGKCEFLNPGGSVKDRAAYQIIKDALIKDVMSNSPMRVFSIRLNQNYLDRLNKVAKITGNNRNELRVKFIRFLRNTRNSVFGINPQSIRKVIPQKTLDYTQNLRIIKPD